MNIKNRKIKWGNIFAGLLIVFALFFGAFVSNNGHFKIFGKVIYVTGGSTGLSIVLVIIGFLFLFITFYYTFFGFENENHKPKPPLDEISKKKKEMKSFLFSIIFIIAIGVIITLTHFIIENSKHRKLDLFKKHIIEYGKLYFSDPRSTYNSDSFFQNFKEKKIQLGENTYTLKSLAISDVVYIRGKIILVDISGFDEIDKLYFQIPKNIRASNPEEVGTVLQLDWNKVKVGEYISGEVAYRIDCKVNIIDKTINKYLATILFKGPAPPDRLYSGSLKKGVGKKPINEIIEFIIKLPRK